MSRTATTAELRAAAADVRRQLRSLHRECGAPLIADLKRDGARLAALAELAAIALDGAGAEPSPDRARAGSGAARAPAPGARHG